MTSEPTRPRQAGLAPGRAIALPCGLGVALLGVALFSLRTLPDLFWATAAAGGVLVLWSLAVYVAVRRSGRALTLEHGTYKHHWVQASAQAAVLAYWGWHTDFGAAFVPLVIAQLVFAYGVDALLTWSRRDTYRLGFGPFPIVLSINLFLWFRPEWFYWQYAMILIGYAAKELIRWERDGRSAHIFNPSSFPLGLFAVVLLLTGTSDITFGSLIAATQHDPPYMYLLIFLVALPGQLLFGVARMTLPSVVALYAISVLYFKTTGTYLFYDTHIPVPVFLGMHLLFTDPSTSPRTELGRLIFGVMYGCLTATFYTLLASVGAPTFYDKLLPVPIMNLTVRRIDRLVKAMPLALRNLSLGARLMASSRGDLVYVSLWVVTFTAMSGIQAIGDRHAGQYLPFWESVCESGSTRACDYASFLMLAHCENGSGWACKELGVARARADRSPASMFERACDLGFSPACGSPGRSATELDNLARIGPQLEELPIVLAGTKPPLRERSPVKLYALGCSQGWRSMCGD